VHLLFLAHCRTTWPPAQLAVAERQSPPPPLARLPGIGQVLLYVLGRLFEMRVWLDDPRKVAESQAAPATWCTRFKTSEPRGFVPPAVQSVPPDDSRRVLPIRGQCDAGYLATEEEFRRYRHSTLSARWVVTRPQGLGQRIELGASEYARRSTLLDKVGRRNLPRYLPAHRIHRAANFRTASAHDEELRKDIPRGRVHRIVYDPTQFVRASLRRSSTPAGNRSVFVVIVVIIFLCRRGGRSSFPLLAVPVSIIGTFCVLLRWGSRINALSLFGLVLISIDRHRRRRCDRRGGKRGAATRHGLSAMRGQLQGDARVSRAADRCHCADSICRVRSARVVSGCTGQFFKQLAH